MTGLDMVIWLLVLFIIFAKPNQVPQDERWVMTIFGKYFRTLDPGLQFTIRGIEEIATSRQTETENMPTSTTEAGQVELIREDGIDRRYKKTPKGVRSTRIFSRIFIVKNTITQDGITIPEVQFQIGNQMGEDPDAAYKSTFALAGPVRESLKVIANGTIRSVFGKHPLQGTEEIPGILDKPDVIKNEIIEGISDGVEHWGDKVIWFKMEEVVPPESVRKVLQAPFEARKAGEALVATATQSVLAAEQEKKAKITTAEGEKQKIILDAEAQKQKEILEAESKAAPLQKVAKIFGWRKDGDPALKLRTSQSAADYMTIDDRTKAALEMGKGAGTFVFHDGQNGLLEGAVGVVGKVFRKIEANEAPPTKPS